MNPRKRRRRRRLDRPAISARLLLDDRLKGEVGVLSEDLFGDLFPGAKLDGGCFLLQRSPLASSRSN